MKSYKVLKRSVFENENFKIIPIRYEDRFEIMQWRNQQIYHLRQNRPLTEEDQENYFKIVVAQLFEQEQPNQILFSFLQNNELVGYGGLVHINWNDKHAEISFIMNTKLEEFHFIENWCIFLKLIESVAFFELDFHKLFTYAYDVRPKLYEALEARRFEKEAILKEHCFIDSKFLDVVIHSKRQPNIISTLMEISDVEMTYNWASNPLVRKYAYSQDKITFESHRAWFINKINDKNCVYYKCYLNENCVGSIRFDIENKQGLISYLIDPLLHGKGYGKFILYRGFQLFFKENFDIEQIIGYVLKDNTASLRAFRDLGFIEIEEGDSFKFIKKRN